MTHTSMNDSICAWWDISDAAKHACLQERVIITVRLWQQIAGEGFPFAPDDYRLRELCWGLQFARAGLSQATTTRLPRAQAILFNMVYDPPSTLEQVTATFVQNSKGQRIIIMEAPAA